MKQHSGQWDVVWKPGCNLGAKTLLCVCAAVNRSGRKRKQGVEEAGNGLLRT